MPTTEARIGFGAQFKTENDDSPATFTSWGQITNLKPPAISIDSIDASHEQSDGTAREFIPGMVDYGETSFDLNFKPRSATDQALLAEASTRPTKKRRIYYPDGVYDEFDAFLTGYEPDAPMDDKMSASVTFKVTGPVVRYAAA